MGDNGPHYVEEAKRLLAESMDQTFDPSSMNRLIARAQVNATLAVAQEVRNLKNEITNKETTR